MQNEITTLVTILFYKVLLLSIFKGSVNWIIAKGLSSFAAGQILQHTSLNLQQLFQLASLYTSAATTLFYIIFWIWGRKLERKRAAKVEEQRLALEAKAKESGSEIDDKPAIEEFVQNYGSTVTLEDTWGTTNL